VDTETPRPEKLVVDFDTTVNSTPTDISGKGNHGAFYGTNMNYSSADKAFVFNGTDDYIDMTSVSGISDSNPFTVSFWVNVDVNTGERCFMQYGAESPNDSIGVKLNGSYDEIEFFFYSNDIRFTWTPDVHRWYHVVARYDGGTDSGVTSGQIGVSRKIWVDGVELLVAPGARATSGTITSPSLPANSDLHIGVRIASGGYIDGQISNFKLYNVALEPSEVKKLYNLGRTGRSMVISDTAVGIGKVPEAQLDVRGTARFGDVMVNGVIKSNVPSWGVHQFDGASASGYLEFTDRHITEQNCTVTLSTQTPARTRITATVSGRYFVSFVAFTDHSVTAGTTNNLSLAKNGSTYSRSYHVQPMTGYDSTTDDISSNYSATCGMSIVVDLLVNDYLEMSSEIALHNNANGYFSGFMIG